MRRRMIAGIGAVVAGAVVIGAAVTVGRDVALEPSAGQTATTLVTGFHSAGEKFDLGGRTVDRGRYIAGYSLEVKLVSAMPDATLECMLVDLSGRITGFTQQPLVAQADGKWTRLGFSDDLELPEVTLSIRCSPTLDGELSANFRDVEIFADEKVLRDRD